ncbi:hypothetical protein AArcMg_2853 [Natrarchaeobaculum sulfurireducens]|uniref:Uncharacterized protein n=1 Tax=Natrarchaeobaculum sulfurireducens TaxID=2044521 RepID=A0A346PTJ7_9EURY|nr:hypothetical protein AArcMg_2853 [Natrarchaeobaculum sulfurireducens]
MFVEKDLLLLLLLSMRMHFWKRARLFWVKGWGLPRRKIDERIGTRLLKRAHSIKSQLGPKKYVPIDPYGFVKLSPSEITHVQTLPVDHPLAEHDGRFYKYCPGRLIDGDWDQAITPIEEAPLYLGLRERFVDGKPWDETLLHPNRYNISHPNLSERYNNYSVAEFHDRCEYLEKLYDSLETTGYSDPGNRNTLNELAINVGSDGQLIRNSEGIHRLMLARLLDLDYVFARIHVVHPEAVSDLESIVGRSD